MGSIHEMFRTIRKLRGRERISMTDDPVTILREIADVIEKERRGITDLREIADVIEKERPFAMEAINLLREAKLNSSTWSIRVKDFFKKLEEYENSE
jgi:hypothetical protein